MPSNNKKETIKIKFKLIKYTKEENLDVNQG